MCGSRPSTAASRTWTLSAKKCSACRPSRARSPAANNCACCPKNHRTPATRSRRPRARAVQLAAQGLYTTDPNPRVGSVIVKDGVVVGEGWHVRAGEPHAEVLALKQAG